MSYVDIKSKFHVALNGVGLILQGAPDRLGYQQSQSPVYGQRFASGDRDYNDLSQWWYFVQTDWSGGVKDSVSWLNDAKFFSSSNIDTWSEPGAIKLTREQYPAGSGGDNDFTYDVSCGFEGEVNGTVSKFVASTDGADSRPHIWKASSGEDQSFTDISTTTISANQNIVSQMSARLGLLWASIIGSGSTHAVVTWDGTTWVDQTGYIYTDAALTYTPSGSSCHVDYLGTMYVFVLNSINKQYALVKTTDPAPGSGDWTKVFEMLNTSGIPVSCAVYNGKIHYLVNKTYFAEYWQYDIANSTNLLVRKFSNTNLQTWSTGDKLFNELNGKLVITVPDSEIWELDGDTLTRIYIKDTFKGTLGNEYTSYLHYGSVISDNKVWWGNLMYDGSNFYNTWKTDSDSTSGNAFPLFTDSVGRIWESYGSDLSVIWSVNVVSGSLYKGTADKNFIIFSNFDNISGVEKLGYSVNILFKPLISGQKISVEYILGELTAGASWTALGNASYSVDGGTVTSKNFLFPAGTLFNKIWFRIKLESGGSDTPTMTDFAMEYLPMPAYKKNWSININCADSIKNKDGLLNERTGRELRNLLEKSWATKSVLDFQDLDYATTQINGSLSASGTSLTVDDTKDFAEQGRIKIDDEEIFYTGKTPTTFTGLVRGYRGTRAVSHSDNAVVNNAYKVIVTDFNSRVPIGLKERELEYTVGIALREV